jgi:hypothetical protein
MRYVVIATGGKVVYCQSRTEATHVAQEIQGRIYRADWSEVVQA